MRVNTKYQVGDIVYFADDPKKEPYKVAEVKVVYTEYGIFKDYTVKNVQDERFPCTKENELCLLALRGSKLANEIVGNK